MSDIEYNDFGFTAMDADELASVDTKIVEKTTTANEVIDQMDNFIRWTCMNCLFHNCS